MVLVFRRALLAAEDDDRNEEPPTRLCRPVSRPCESDSEEPSRMSSSIRLKDATWSSSSAAFVGTIQKKEDMISSCLGFWE